MNEFNKLIDSFSESFKHYGIMLYSFKKQQEQLNMIPQILMPNINLYKQIEDFSKQTLIATKQIEDFSKSFSEIIKNTEESVRKFREMLSEPEFSRFEYKWVLHLSLRKMQYLYYLWKDGKKEEVHNYFLNYFNKKENCEDLILKFRNKDHFKSREHLMRLAIINHLNKNYEISIPLLIIQIDGISIDEGRLRKIVDKTGRRLIIENCRIFKNVSPEKKPPLAIFDKILKKIINTNIKHFYKWIEFLRKRRDEILHGKDIDYYKKEGAYFSTKLILTLDLMYDLFN